MRLFTPLDAFKKSDLLAGDLQNLSGKITPLKTLIHIKSLTTLFLAILWTVKFSRKDKKRNLSRVLR